MKFTTIERPNYGSSTKIEKNQISQIPYQIGDKEIEKPVSEKYIIEYKERYLKRLSNLESISEILPKWNESIKNLINEDSWGDDVFNLGDNFPKSFSVVSIFLPRDRLLIFSIESLLKL